MTHTHKEAFCLMWYACQSCFHREVIWNSRDGVTPFGLGCPSCGGNLLHTDFEADAFAPHHKLNLYQRYFRDGTPEEALAIVRRRIGNADGTEYEVPHEEREELVIDIVNGHEFQPGWPMVDVFRGD